MSGIPYTKEQLAFMEKHGADMTTTELTNALNKAFSTGHTAGSVRTTLKNMGILKSKETRARNCAMNGEPIGSAKIKIGPHLAAQFLFLLLRILRVSGFACGKNVPQNVLCFLGHVLLKSQVIP